MKRTLIASAQIRHKEGSGGAPFPYGLTVDAQNELVHTDAGRDLLVGDARARILGLVGGTG